MDAPPPFDGASWNLIRDHTRGSVPGLLRWIIPRTTLYGMSMDRDMSRHPRPLRYSLMTSSSISMDISLGGITTSGSISHRRVPQDGQRFGIWELLESQEAPHLRHLYDLRGTFH